MSLLLFAGLIFIAEKIPMFADPSTPAVAESPSGVSEREMLLSQVAEWKAHIFSLGKTDLNSALTYIETEVAPTRRLWAKEALMVELGSANLQTMDEIPRVLPEPGSRGTTVLSIADAWIEKDSGAIVKFVEAHPKSSFFDLIKETLIVELVRKDRLEEAKSIADRELRPGMKTRFITRAAIQCSAKDIDAVLRWVTSDLDPAEADRVGRDLGRFHSKDPEILRRIALSMSPEKRMWVWRDLGLVLGQNGIGKVLQEIRHPELSESDRDAILVAAMDSVAFSDLTRLLDVATASKILEIRQDAAIKYVRRTLEIKPQIAEDWVKTAPDDMRQAAIPNLVMYWDGSDLEPLFSWIKQLRQPSDRDLALYAIIRRTRASKPDDAKHAAEQISDPVKREQQLKLLQ